MDITNLLTDLASVVHGTTVNKIPNIYGMINRAARAVLLDVDPKETQRIVQMPQIFDNVFDYAIPVDVKGDRIIDLGLPAGRVPWETFSQTYAVEFDVGKEITLSNKVYTQWNTGVKTIRIDAPFLTSPTTLTDTGTLTGWSGINGATNLSLDTVYNVAGGGDITFDLSAGQFSGSIQNTTLTAVDLSGLAFTGTGFVWAYFPDGSAITSITAIWGSSPNNNYQKSATTTQSGTTFANGWNLIAFPWVSASVANTPISSAIDEVDFTIAYNGILQTGVKICNFTFAPGFYFNLQYYSKYLFRDPSTNVFQETVVDVTDNNKLINLDTESYNLLFNKTAFFIAQSLQGADAGYDANYWDSEYQESLKRYKGQNPSEAMLKGSTYYRLPRKGYTGYGRFFRQ